MKAAPLLALAAAVSAALVAACSSAPSAPATAPEASATRYSCESGDTVIASYPTTDTARVRYQERNHDMLIAVSASGARYVGGGLEWWTKGSGPGSEGMVLRHLDNGGSGEILDICTAS